MATHHIAATPATVRWGQFDAAFPPVLTINSGETVVLECVSGAPETLPPPGSGFQVPPALAAIHAAVPRGAGHIITGPVAVAGAEPGDMLEVKIEKIAFGADWGFCGFRPLAGTLPEDFPERFLTHIPVDRARGTCKLPYGAELDLAPFFGVMGVAPRPAYGTISTIQPREHGGNLDNKELGAGTTLFLPVWAPGALFSAGDGHGVQGDGEVCINALEMCLTGTFTLTLHKKAGPGPLLAYPRAETATHYITMGMNEDLDLAMKQALREMIAFICSRSNLSRQEAYQFCSLAVDFRVTQTVNGEKGIHGLLKRGLLF
ncbi:acetamidase/formamidase family protein [Limobrevibacterium gyesilva]|uniref:Acetamidase/formamidase family protein n=1 Tax=Limobrevibacterium gyesilva TaxID=2991712 RepID=A0AA41YPW7_9PROT|nr:acetamidase/formamidase family protein [Limobrevibacterium gyesilva]MCW3473367.1 acetamidase/formamidase family protein [Limobrevibacterium gyesilva]